MTTTKTPPPPQKVGGPVAGMIREPIAEGKRGGEGACLTQSSRPPCFSQFNITNPRIRLVSLNKRGSIQPTHIRGGRERERD